jgi:hypothetical protein
VNSFTACNISLPIPKTCLGMDKGDYMDGLLEGHESGAVKWVNRLGLIAFAILSGVAMVLDFASAAMKGGGLSSPFVGVAILGLTVLVFMEVLGIAGTKWRRSIDMLLYI